SAILLFYSILVIPAGSTLFPYTTLFRSKPRRGATPASRGRPDPSPGTGRTGRTGEGNRAPSLRWGTATRRPGSTPGQTTLPGVGDRKSTRLNSSHVSRSYAVFCLKKKIE